ncbi:MAG: tRNA (N(6)-L-threonylcarbamoyladenosine(37)-C(2))-methylthiotransferase MtaB [Alphaproteobacteria bacterium]|nr:tRNA (N(6)-L-threonylcarbamoyladenosine(37)-C(2))-methylthiotransferase MtaB [Alphaproteobacteria bacterium]
MTTEIMTFGCRMNAFESEVMRDHARAAGLEGAVIVNTCAVTGEAERQARQAIRKLKRERPDARIIVTGCAAQLHPETFAAMPEVERVLGNMDKLKAENFVPDLPARVAVADIMGPAEAPAHVVSGLAERSRAFVQIQQGCDHRCTFCVIPFARGPGRSVPLARIVAQTRELVANGYREVVLTGVDIASHGVDLAHGTDLGGRPDLGRAVRGLLDQVPELERLRLGSLDPAGIGDDLLALFRDEERLMPHVHLSLQAGDDMVLKRMARRHLRGDALRVAAALAAARPGIALGADIIAGFPGETDAMFENSLALIGDCGLSHLHVFPFSPRQGTPAARMPAVPGTVVRERAARLREAGRLALARRLRLQVGTVAAVLVEKPGFGHSEHYFPVRLPPGDGHPGAVVPLRIDAATDTGLTGRAAP